MSSKNLIKRVQAIIQKRSKAIIKTELNTIKGISEKTSEVLLKEFIHLRDNSLKMRNNISSNVTGQLNFVLPFNNDKTLQEFDLNLKEDDLARNQLVIFHAIF